MFPLQKERSLENQPSVPGASTGSGVLVINADDWGQNVSTTDRTLECIRLGGVSSVSAMVFMQDSERAAVTARESGIDAGLHLNFTTPFSSPSVPGKLADHHQRVSRYLRRNRYAQIFFNPALTSSFQYVVAAQIDEFTRLYGAGPDRIDGHHHMHLCANVVFSKLLPLGVAVRRNFTFVPGEKGFCNRMYRQTLDGVLRRRHHLMDCLFTLPPLHPPHRIERIFSLASRLAVEVETHPINVDEYQFLTGGELSRRGLAVSSRYAVPRNRTL